VASDDGSDSAFKLSAVYTQLIKEEEEIEEEITPPVEEKDEDEEEIEASEDDDLPIIVERQVI